MISRTIRTNIYRAVGINEETGEGILTEIAVPSTIRKGKPFNDYCKELYGFVPAQVFEIDHTERLYGISEEDFLFYAVELDPETRKPLNK